MKKSKMKRISGAFLSLVLIITMICGSALSVSAAVDENLPDCSVDSNSWPGWPAGPDIGGTTAVLYDADTGVVLYDKGKDVQRYPASITKIMTALLTLENCDLNATVTMTETGLADAYVGSSNINPQLGEQFTVYQCLQMMLVKSANDVSSQMAEYIGGSVAGFADMMNSRAAELGCTNTHFANANGLEDTNHYTSAYDMALITNEAIKHQEFLDIIGSLQVVIPATNMSDQRVYDTHLDIMTESSGVKYDYCIGGKTGNTDIAMSTLVCVAKKDGRTLIGVIMHHPDWGQMSIDMGSLFEYGFNNFAYTDMSFGVPMVSGGTALLPVGTDPKNIGIEYTENGDNYDLTYTCNGQTVGSGTVAADNLKALLVAHGDITEEEEPELPEDETGVAESSEGLFSKSSDLGGFKMSNTVLILVAIAAAVLIVIIIVSVVMDYKKKQRRRRRLQRKREMERRKREQGEE